LLAPRESARGAVSHLFVKNKTGERNPWDAQLPVTAARSAAVTMKVTGAQFMAHPVDRLVSEGLVLESP